jgi:hypothetical protein
MDPPSRIIPASTPYRGLRSLFTVMGMSTVDAEPDSVKLLTLDILDWAMIDPIF